MMNSKRWEQELQRRVEALKPAEITSADEFDAVFGENIAKTMSGYMLVVLTLADIKRSLLRAIQVFFVMSAVFFVAILSVVILSYRGSYAKENNDRLKDIQRLADRNACVSAEAADRAPPPGIDCDAILRPERP